MQHLEFLEVISLVLFFSADFHGHFNADISSFSWVGTLRPSGLNKEMKTEFSKTHIYRIPRRKRPGVQEALLEEEEAGEVCLCYLIGFSNKARCFIIFINYYSFKREGRDHIHNKNPIHPPPPNELHSRQIDHIPFFRKCSIPRRLGTAVDEKRRENVFSYKAVGLWLNYRDQSFYFLKLLL